MRIVTSSLLWAYWTICFHLCLLIVLVLFIVTYPFDPYRRIPNRALKLLAWLVMKPVPTWNIEIQGADIKEITEPTLVVANHQSFLDMPLLYLLPWNMKWLTKKSLLRIPVLGWLIAMTGHIPIDRQSLRSFKAMDAMVDPIKKGMPGMIFPEGTRTKDGSVGLFKRGAFVLAEKYNFQVLPVVLEGGHRGMPRGAWKFRFHNKFVVSVLKPVNPSDFEDADDLRNYVQHKIEEELDSIQAEHK